MPIKRTRTARSCAHLENEAHSPNAEIRPAEQSSSATGAQNKAARTSMSVDQVPNPPIPPPSQLREVIFTVESPPPPPQRPPPFQTQLTGGGGYALHTNPRLPPAFLDACNYCKKRIGPGEDRYMNGFIPKKCRGLEAYCSSACREKFNNMMIAAGKRSHETEQSMDHHQWHTKK
ncbi:hypothetical protein LXL04_001031 [Taraxacum kok-saghyz]